MGQGPYGPRAHMGPGPYGPGARARAPGPHFLGERIFKQCTLKKQACGFCSKHNRKTQNARRKHRSSQFSDIGYMPFWHPAAFRIASLNALLAFQRLSATHKNVLLAFQRLSTFMAAFHALRRLSTTLVTKCVCGRVGLALRGCIPR